MDNFDPYYVFLLQIYLSDLRLRLWSRDTYIICYTKMLGLLYVLYYVWVKIIDFSFMPKIIMILSKDHVP